MKGLQCGHASEGRFLMFLSLPPYLPISLSLCLSSGTRRHLLAKNKKERHRS